MNKDQIAKIHNDLRDAVVVAERPTEEVRQQMIAIVKPLVDEVEKLKAENEARAKIMILIQAFSNEMDEKMDMVSSRFVAESINDILLSTKQALKGDCDNG